MEKENSELEVNKFEIEGKVNEENLEKENNENKPSEEEIAEAKEEFEKAKSDFNVKMWSIGDAEKATNIYNQIEHFIQHRIFWSKNGWMGILKLTEELENAYKVANSTNEPIKLGYQAIEFLYYSLSNPAGIGIESAKMFESEYENFMELFKMVEDVLDIVRKELNDIQFLQEKWGSMSQGFYLEREDGVVEEEKKQKETSSEEVSPANDKDLDKLDI